MGIERRLIYLLQTKLETELSDELLHDIHCAIQDTRKTALTYTEHHKVKYYNELKLWGKRHQNETINSLVGRLEKDESIRH